MNKKIIRSLKLISILSLSTSLLVTGFQTIKAFVKKADFNNNVSYPVPKYWYWNWFEEDFGGFHCYAYYYILDGQAYDVGGAHGAYNVAYIYYEVPDKVSDKGITLKLPIFLRKEWDYRENKYFKTGWFNFSYYEKSMHTSPINKLYFDINWYDDIRKKYPYYYETMEAPLYLMRFADRAFEDQEISNIIDFPYRTKHIGERAFANTKATGFEFDKLNTIPKNDVFFGKGAFADNLYLEGEYQTVKIPRKMTRTPDEFFMNSNVSGINFDLIENDPTTNYYSFGKDSFKNTKISKPLVFSSKLKFIDNGSFGKINFVKPIVFKSNRPVDFAFYDKNNEGWLFESSFNTDESLIYLPYNQYNNYLGNVNFINEKTNIDLQKIIRGTTIDKLNLTNDEIKDISLNSTKVINVELNDLKENDWIDPKTRVQWKVMVS